MDPKKIINASLLEGASIVKWLATPNGLRAVIDDGSREVEGRYRGIFTAILSGAPFALVDYEDDVVRVALSPREVKDLAAIISIAVITYTPPEKLYPAVRNNLGEDSLS